MMMAIATAEPRPESTSVANPTPRRREGRFATGLFVTALLGVLLVQNAYPVYQVFTYGRLFYANADDEPSYLQYDFALASRALSRSSAYLVVALHDVGIPAGVQNLLFDVVCTIGIAVFARRAFLAAGFEEGSASRNAFLLLIVPLLLGGANPLVQKLYWWNLDSHAIRWIAVPQGPYSPLVRTPEPQFSLLLVTIATSVALRRRAFWPLYAVLPLLYTFVTVPVLFVALTLHLRATLNRKRWPTWVAPLVAFTVIGVLLGVYHALFVSATMKEFLVATRLPIVSFTGLLGCTIAALGHWHCPAERRPLLWAVAAAPLAAVNEQLFSGWLAAPHCHEQYMGVACCSLAAVLALNGRWLTILVMIVATVQFAVHARREFMTQRWVAERLDWNEELLMALREDSSHTAINDVNLAMNANMLFARQPSTAFGFERSFAAVATDAQVRDYLAAREQVLRDPQLAPQFRDLFNALDTAYAFQGRNIAPLHLYRRPLASPVFDVKTVPDDLPATTLRVFTLRK